MEGNELSVNLAVNIDFVSSLTESSKDKEIAMYSSTLIHRISLSVIGIVSMAVMWMTAYFPVANDWWVWKVFVKTINRLPDGLDGAFGCAVVIGWVGIGLLVFWLLSRLAYKLGLTYDE